MMRNRKGTGLIPRCLSLYKRYLSSNILNLSKQKKLLEVGQLQLKKGIEEIVSSMPFLNVNYSLTTLVA